MKVSNITVCATCESSDSGCFEHIVSSRDETIKSIQPTNRLIFVLSGALSIHTESKEKVICTKDEVVLLLRDKNYDIKVLKNAELLIYSFLSPYQVCDKMRMKDMRHNLDMVDYSFHTLPFRAPLKLIIESALFYMDDNIECGYWQKAKQLDLYIIFWHYYTLDEICRFFYPLINKDTSFQAKALANCCKARTVSELAFLCGYSLSKFNKLFRNYFQGTSPYQWMLQQKAPMIRTQLLDKGVPVKKIVAEYNFIDHSHLNRYCKRFFNATALQIRAENE